MIFRFFLLLSTVLFSLSILAAEKLVIVPAETDNIPEEVKNAVKAIGAVNGRTGFFLDKGVFVASGIDTNTINPAAVHRMTQLGKANAREAEALGHILEGDLVDISGGQAVLMKVIDNWGVFKVNSDGEERLFTREVDRPLEISEFRKGDRVFLLNMYAYNDYRKNLVMEVANFADIQDIEADVDLEKSSPMLDPLRVQLDGSIAVNQRGEVVGFLSLEQYGNKRLVKFDSEKITFFSEEAKKIRLQEKYRSAEGYARFVEEHSGESMLDAWEAMGASVPEKYRGAEGYARFVDEYFGESMREAWEAMGASIPEEYRGAKGYDRFVEEHFWESAREAWEEIPEEYKDEKDYDRLQEEWFGENMREAWEAMGASVPEEYRGAKGYDRFVGEHSGERMRRAAMRTIEVEAALVEDTPIGQAVRATNQRAYAQSVTDTAHGTEETSSAAADTEGNENPKKQSLFGRCTGWLFRR